MARPWNAYEAFLLSNASQITAVESSLRSITYILPGRFKDAELAGEAIYTALHLLGMYHDSLLFRIVYARNGTSEAPLRERMLAGDAPRLSLHARYTNYWRSHSRSYRLAAVWLMVIESTQLLTEMLARRRFGQRRGWDVVIALECVKAVLRATLVRSSHERPVVSPPLPQREIDPALLEQGRLGTLDTRHALTWHGARTGIVRKSLATLLPPRDAPAPPAGPLGVPPEKDVYEYLLSNTLTVQDVEEPPLLVRPLQASVGRLAEALYVLRPLLYVLALRRYSARDAKPFVLSLALELLARSLRKQSFVMGHKGDEEKAAPPMSSVSLLLNMLGIENSFLDWLTSLVSSRNPRSALAKPISTVEADEWAGRGRDFWWYLLRGPVWYTWTRPKIAAFASATENRRLIGIIGSIARDYLPLVDDYYYYSSS